MRIIHIPGVQVKGRSMFNDIKNNESKLSYTLTASAIWGIMNSQHISINKDTKLHTKPEKAALEFLISSLNGIKTFNMLNGNQIS